MVAARSEGAIPERAASPDETTRTLFIRLERRTDNLESFGLGQQKSLADVANMLVEQRTVLRAIDDKLGEHKERLSGLQDRIRDVELGRAHEGGRAAIGREYAMPVLVRGVVFLLALGAVGFTARWSAPHSPSAAEIAAAVRAAEGHEP